MATAIASESSSQLARLGLSEAEFKRKADLMRQYLQDNSGASSFEEFCKRQPTAAPDPPHRPPPQKPAAHESTKNSSSGSSKPSKVAPSFPPMGLPIPGGPLGSQMFGMMPPQVCETNFLLNLHYILLQCYLAQFYAHSPVTYD